MLTGLLTICVSVYAARVQLWLCWVRRSVWPSIERSQRLEHAQQTVGGRELQVFLWDIAHLTCLIACLRNKQTTTTKEAPKIMSVQTVAQQRSNYSTGKKNAIHIYSTWLRSGTLTQSSMSPSSMTSNISCSSIVNSSGWEAWGRDTAGVKERKTEKVGRRVGEYERRKGQQMWKDRKRE